MTAHFQIGKSDMAFQMIVYIMFEISEIGGACGILVFQMKFGYKKLGQNGVDQAGFLQLVF